MSSLVLKKQKTSENHAAADTTHQTESQSNVPCPPRLHRSKTATKKTKTLAEKKQSPQQPVESDEAPDLLDCEMDTDPTSGEQLEQEDQEGQSDQESLKVIIFERKLPVFNFICSIIFRHCRTKTMKAGAPGIHSTVSAEFLLPALMEKWLLLMGWGEMQFIL